MNYKIYILIIFIIGFYSCEFKVKSVDNNERKGNHILVESLQFESKKEIKFKDTIKINYSAHKTLLDILKILPETTMRSWEWSKKDRIQMVEFIKNNNYLIDSTETYNNIKYIKPNTIGIQVVDGFWTLSIYDFGKNGFLIVTNDIVGDGNDIQTFSFKNNKLTPTKMANWFCEFQYELLLNNSTTCIDFLHENEWTYDYDFSDKEIVEISSWLLTEKKLNSCLKGNSIKYKLNLESKTFDIISVFWKKNKAE